MYFKWFKNSYNDEYEKICAEQGTLSDDGNAWVDKYSGYVIGRIDFDTEEGYDEPIDSNYKPPINQFIESVNELGLNLSNDLTEEIINEAYLKCVTKYQKFLQDKIEPEFKISVKETAWEYLINSLRLSTKVKNMK